ncbi:MAG: glucose uptake permease [Verrucomicrobia bacterium]|nr:MAG: glucose uptake permease [Verrucomicrobiota bacterium]
MQASRLRTLQALGVFCGFAAGAWLGGAEAPIKIVNTDISPITVSFIMVVGVFLARWSIPAIVCGTSYVRKDVRQAPHLIIWAVLAGCMWAVANTMTIYAIRDVGLSIAFPLWNTKSLLGIFWGFVLFNELHQAGWSRWLGVLGGALAMFGGATLLAFASSTQAPAGKATLGVIAALGAGILWGTMYIPYRKAYVTGMNPLSFITFFTVGELATMTFLALSYRGAIPLWHEIVGARTVLFWLMLGGFVWVIGDLFQQYAAKYVGISRGVPLSNTRSILMALGAVAIALSSATGREHSCWQDAAEREGKRYGIEDAYVRASMEGREFAQGQSRRTLIDWVLVSGVTAIFVALAAIARLPRVDIDLRWAAAVSVAMLLLLVGCGIALWRTTRFS